MAKEKLSYESAFEELQSIVNAIDSESVSVDELATKVERASELIKFCSKKLRDTERVLLIGSFATWMMRVRNPKPRTAIYLFKHGEIINS